MKSTRLPAALLVLLLVAAASPTSDAQATGDLEIQDGRGDVNLLGLSPLALPSTAATDPVDITAFRIYGEDVDGLTIEFAVANLRTSPEAVRSFGGGQFYVDFMLEGSQVSYYTIFQLYDNQGDPIMGTAPTGITRLPAQFSVCVPDSGCFSQRILGYVDWDESLIRGYLPKGALAGREPIYSEEYPQGMPAVRAGSRLASIQAGVYGNLGLYDVVPDSGFAGPYVLKAGVPNERIGLSLAQFEEGVSFSDFSGFAAIADYPAVTVTPGTPSLVQLRVLNHNQAKRIVNLTTQLVDPAQATKWSLRVVNTVTIPGTDERVVNLIVNATEKVAHRDEALVRVSARSLGFPEEIGSLRLRLVGSVPPTPTKNTLFLHSADPQSTLSFCIGCNDGELWMNTLEDDPQALDDLGTPMGWSSGILTTEFYFDAYLDTQLGADLVLDENKPIIARIVSQCALCPAGTLTLRLESDQGPIASGTAPFSTSVEVELMPETGRILAGSYLGLFGSIESTSPPPAAEDVTPRIMGKQSSVKLPVVRDPEAKATGRIPLGPAFLTLSADNVTGEFIAPGESKVFPVTIVNEGVEEDVAHIAIETDRETWRVTLQPGDAYRLKPGESATFGVLIRAPVNASEGDTLEVLVNATSDIDENALDQLIIEVTASGNAFEEEEAEEFAVDEDTEKALEERGNKSPGLGFAALLLPTALVALLQRRRRTRPS